MGLRLGTSAGISGLATGVDRVAEAQRSISTLQQLDNGIQKDKAESLMMQEMEAKQYEEIKNKASELLERDRDRIRVKSIELQSAVRSKIKEYGSRKAFFENGGLALLSKYKSDLLTSKETMLFKDNKENLTRILAMQEAGKGGQLSKIDLLNLQNYQDGKSDVITYSGLKSQIDIPERAFDYGEVIAAKKILHYGNNYMSVYANFLKDHPSLKGLKGEDLENQLLMYTKQEHGQSQGLDHYHEEERSRKALRDEERKAASSGSEEQEPESYLNLLNTFVANSESVVPKNIDTIMGTAPSKDHPLGESYFDLLGKKNKGVAGLLGDRTHQYTEAINDNLGFFSFENTFGKANKFMPASAYKILPYNKEALNKIAFGTYDEKAGYGFSFDNDVLDPKGQPLTDDKIKEYNKDGKGATIKPKGYFLGWQDENGKLVTTLLNSDKKRINKDAENDHKKGYSGKVSHNLFAAFQDDDGHTFYKRVSITNPQREKEISLAIGAGDNITSVVKGQNKINNEINQEKMRLFQKSDAVYKETNRASSKGGAFTNPNFIAEARSYTVSGQGDRNKLLKAYYQAMSHLRTGGEMSARNLKSNGDIDTNQFTSMVNKFPELKNMAINPKGVNDIEFMKKFTETISEGDDEHLQENKEFESIWSAYYNLILQNK